MRIHVWSIPIGTVLLFGVVANLYFSHQYFLQSNTDKKGNLSAEKWPLEKGKTYPSGTPQTVIKDHVFQRVHSAVVTIYGAEGLGSGMILRPKGLILTNKHIVKNSANVVVKTADGETHAGTVVDFDLQHDLALVKLNTANLNLPTVAFASAPALKPSMPIYAIGSPGGKAGTITEGTFTRLTEHGSIQTSSGLLESGNSGGPLLNSQGEVIGVNKGLLRDRSGLASNLSAARALIHRYDQVNKTESSFDRK